MSHAVAPTSRLPVRGALSPIALDGESNWLEGTLLTIVYIVLAISFFELR